MSLRYCASTASIAAWKSFSPTPCTNHIVHYSYVVILPQYLHKPHCSLLICCHSPTVPAQTTWFTIHMLSFSHSTCTNHMVHYSHVLILPQYLHKPHGSLFICCHSPTCPAQTTWFTIHALSFSHSTCTNHMVQCSYVVILPQYLHKPHGSLFIYCHSSTVPAQTTWFTIHMRSFSHSTCTNHMVHYSYVVILRLYLRKPHGSLFICCHSPTSPAQTTWFTIHILSFSHSTCTNHMVHYSYVVILPHVLHKPHSSLFKHHHSVPDPAKTTGFTIQASSFSNSNCRNHRVHYSHIILPQYLHIPHGSLLTLSFSHMSSTNHRVQYSHIVILPHVLHKPQGSFFKHHPTHPAQLIPFTIKASFAHTSCTTHTVHYSSIILQHILHKPHGSLVKHHHSPPHSAQTTGFIIQASSFFHISCTNHRVHSSSIIVLPHILHTRQGSLFKHHHSPTHP